MFVQREKPPKKAGNIFQGMGGKKKEMQRPGRSDVAEKIDEAVEAIEQEEADDGGGRCGCW